MAPGSGIIQYRPISKERYDHFALPQGRGAKKSADFGAAGRLTGQSLSIFLAVVTARLAFSCV
jgi:hypothetical protein